MDGFTLDIIGISDVLKKLDTLSKDIQQDIKDEVNTSALNIQKSAKRLAPIDLGKLRASIYLKETDLSTGGYLFTVGANRKIAPYAPYIEFGTGGEVTVPAGYEELAILFKGKGAKKINIRPQPFLIPSFETEKPKLIKNILNVIKNAKS
jgi:HK97 gp10 family phage protein